MSKRKTDGEYLAIRKTNKIPVGGCNFITCPFCKENGGDIADAHLGTTFIEMNMFCIKCDKVWVETYEISEFRQVSKDFVLENANVNIGCR
ncbi:MAG: hypothetical protein AABY32_01825 [Nanoarchaeota archaeon]